MKQRLVIILLAITAIVGCGTPILTAYKTEGVLITSVDKAMLAWSDYVKGTNHVTQAQIDTVKRAYMSYYTAQMGAKSAVEIFYATPSMENSNAVVQATMAIGQNATGVLTAITANSQGRVH